MSNRSLSFPLCARARRAALGVFIAVAAVPAAAELAISPDALRARVDELTAAALEQPGAVGLSVAVGLGDEMLVEKGYGRIELEHDIAADAGSVFRIGSITKQFTAALVMKLIEDGATKDGKSLTLDSDINDFLDFSTQGKAVTVRHLLTHTSGIKSYTGLGEEWAKTIPLEVSHEELLDLVDDKPFDFEPNEQYRYNNTGYYLLGVLIEEVTGKTYAEALAETFFEPLGLTSIRYGSNSDIIRNRAQGYEMRDGELQNDDLIGMSQPGAAGALISNAADLVRWNQALVSGKVVEPESYAQMTTPHVLESGEATTYGFGLGLDQLDGVRRVQHGGGINGFNSMLAFYPESGLTVAVISNSNGYRAGTLATLIARAALGIELDIRDLPVPPEQIERLSGTYVLQGTPLEMRVFDRDGKLFGQATGQGANLLRYQGVAADGTVELRPDFDDNIRVVFQAGNPAPELMLHQGGSQIRGPRKDEGAGDADPVADLTVDAELGARLVGTYTLTGTPLEFTVTHEGEQLFGQATGQGRTRLRLQGQDDDGKVTVIPDFDDSVKVVFDGGDPAPSLTLFQGGAVIAGPRKDG